MPQRNEKVAQRKADRIQRYVEIEPALVPLCEMFAVVDDVFTEEGAFQQEHIRKSLGRIHRQWKRTRSALDPDFNPESYPKRPRTVRKGLRVGGKTGRSTNSPSAKERPTSSTGKKSTSGKKRKPSGKSGKRSAKRSA